MKNPQCNILKTALIIDFDGTITEDDFFIYIKEAYFNDAALEPWRQYNEGRLTHFNALKKMFSALRVKEEELNKLISGIKIDEWAIPLFKLCHNMQIPVYIASAGCDYYINLLIGMEIKQYEINLITNRSTYSETYGLLMESPSADHLYYDRDTGISKLKVVESLKNNGYRTIFAGDGPPDIEPAKIADIVFAKKILLKKCIEHNIEFKTFNSCYDIYSFIKNEESENTG